MTDESDDAVEDEVGAPDDTASDPDGRDAQLERILTDDAPAPPDGQAPVLQKLVPKQHPDDTRRWLAQWLLGALIALIAVGCYGWFLYGDSLQRMQSFILIFSPIVTLVGTVLAFYFSSSTRD
jgi:hypothetical protein